LRDYIEPCAKGKIKNNKMSEILELLKPFTYLFSYWLLIWFFCFELGWTKYNPFYFFCVALVVILIELGFMIYFQNDLIIILFWVIINFFIKFIPIYLLWGTPFRWKDIQVGLILFGIYLLFLAWNGKLSGKGNFFYQGYLNLKNNRMKNPLTELIRKAFNI
jgi:hypothetical protein